MKSNAKKSVYFSAYPLKVITEKASSSDSPYLRGILSAKTKTIGRTRVFPMVNPYTKSEVKFRPTVSLKTGGMELISKDWFNNYE